MGTKPTTGWAWDDTRYSCDNRNRMYERRSLKRQNSKAQRRNGKRQIATED